MLIAHVRKEVMFNVVVTCAHVNQLITHRAHTVAVAVSVSVCPRIYTIFTVHINLWIVSVPNYFQFVFHTVCACVSLCVLCFYWRISRIRLWSCCN